MRAPWLLVAKKKLSRQGNRFRLTLYAVLLIAIVSFPLVFAIEIGDVSAFAWVDLDASVREALRITVYISVAALLYLLITVPLAGGAWYRAYRVYCEGEHERDAVRYGMCYRLGLRMLGRYAVPLLLILSAYGGIQLLLSSKPDFFLPAVQAIWIFGFVASVFLTLGYFLLTYRGFLIPYFAVRGYSVRDAARASRAVMRGQKSAYRAYERHFFGQIMLSLVTIGVLFALDTYPTMMTAYFALGEELEAHACLTDQTIEKKETERNPL